MQDMSFLTRDGYSWTRDFCSWWFSIDLTDYEEDVCYVYPKAWAKTKGEQQFQRTYIYLYHEMGLVTPLGYINSFTGAYLYAGLERKIEWMHIDDFVREHWQSIVNIARYGIEGCVQKCVDPVASMIEHVLSKMSATEEDDTWTLTWESGFPRPLDARTEWALVTTVLHESLAKKGLELYAAIDGFAEVAPKNNAGKAWLVSRIDREKAQGKEND